MDNILKRLINTGSFRLKINSLLANFDAITALLKQLDIPYEIWTPKNNNLNTDIIELCFDLDCNFIDIYILVYLLKDQKINLIYPTINKSNTVRIGTPIHTLSDPAKFSIVDPKTIESFLLLDPKLTTNTIINQHFYKCIEYVDDDEEHYTYITNQPYTTRLKDHSSNFNDNSHNTFDNNHDYEKDTFNEITDSNFGDYDDFNGDISDIQDWTGR